MGVDWVEFARIFPQKLLLVALGCMVWFLTSVAGWSARGLHENKVPQVRTEEDKIYFSNVLGWLTTLLLFATVALALW